MTDTAGQQATDYGDPLPGESWTELGYAKRLVHVYGDRIRHVVAWRRWLAWDGTRWAPDDTGQVARYAKTIAKRMTAVAWAGLDDKDAGKGDVRFARRCESSAAIAAILNLASTELSVAITPAQLDPDPYLLNCRNGTLDLRTGQLRTHDPADMLTKVTGAAYTPGVEGVEWTKFLDRVQPDDTMRAYLARLFGHALEGRVSEHVLPIMFGEGANGKGTFIGAILGALGDYGDAADPDLLTARSFAAHPTAVADLFGLRLAVLHESDAGRQLAEGTAKRLTGGDRVKARRMREDFWAFDPSHTFVMLTNHKPTVSGVDEGIWRRLRLVPWDVIVPVDERDEHLPERLTLEADAVLAWLVAGYRDWRGRGLDDPEPVTKATASYRAESDALGRFLDERCLLGPHFHTRSSELYGEWARWCGDEGEPAGTNKAFTTAMQNRGYDTERTRVGIVWRGVGLATEEDEQ